MSGLRHQHFLNLLKWFWCAFHAYVFIMWMLGFSICLNYLTFLKLWFWSRALPVMDNSELYSGAPLSDWVASRWLVWEWCVGSCFLLASSRVWGEKALVCIGCGSGWLIGLGRRKTPRIDSTTSLKPRANSNHEQPTLQKDWRQEVQTP